MFDEADIANIVAYERDLGWEVDVAASLHNGYVRRGMYSEKDSVEGE